ncbi:MAG TPA: protein kinase [Myxococcaceae bacterium]|nr:protein kinase [Myxococcaceae bacterium]
MRLAPGSKVGPYEVLASLGAGGMSEVYRVRDPRLQREVALKVVGERLAGDVSFLARLEQEARLAGSLNHPNIVAVHDVGSHEGAPYIVTELLQGETLRDRMSRGRVSLPQALDWGIQIAEGLAAAHQRGIVHRDLKPENVFLTRSGHVKILDFGIAKAAPMVSEPRGLLEATLSPAGYETQTGAVLGTPGYMSPEQVRGEAVDARSDLFAAGSILYELLSGHRAFSGSVVESGHAILHDDPDPLPESVAPPISRVVQRCLAKDPEQRFQSARDLAFALDALRGSTGPAPALEGARGRRRWVRPALALLAIALLAAAALPLLLRREPPTPRVQMLTFRRGSVLGARFAPDEKTVHYSAAWNGAPPQVYTTNLDSPESRPLGFGDAQLLAVSSSGELALSLRPRQILFDGSRGTLARVSPMGGVPRELTTNAEYADWSPDGTQLAVARVEGGRSRLEFPLGHVIFEARGWVSHPRISPDGKRVAFVHHPRPADTAGLLMVVGASGGAEAWSPDFDELLGVAWEPEGRSLLISGSLRGSLDFLWRARRGKEPELVYAAPGNLLLSDLARDGRALVIQTDWRQEIEVVTPDGKQSSLEWLDWGLLSAVTRDGSKVLMAENGKGALGGSILMLRDVAQPAPVRLGNGFPIALSPDGRWAVTRGAGDPKLVLIPTGPGEPRPLPPTGLAWIERGAFFPDGRRLALIGAKTAGGPTALYVYDLKTGDTRAASPEGAGDTVQVSMDGERLAASGPDGAVTAYGLDGKEAFRVDAWGSNFRVAGWLEDGSLLGFQPFELPSRLERYDPRTRSVTLVRMLAPIDPAGVAGIIRVRITPDGKTVAFQHRRMSAVLTVLDWGGRPP